MKTKKITFLAFFFAISTGLFAQQLVVLNFEDEDETAEIIAGLRAEGGEDDWQTDHPEYLRNTYDLNPKTNGMNPTERCASFSGYLNDEYWWYGLDILLAEPITLTPELKYVHAAMMVNNASIGDTNKGLLLRSSIGGGADLKETWTFITEEWADYVFEIPDGAADLWELRFMFNHKAPGLITYLDEIVINNDPTPRTVITTGINSPEKSLDVNVYSAEKTIKINSALPNNKVEVVDITGKRIFFSQSEDNGQITIPVNNAGIYIVKVNENSYKVAVK